MIEVVSHSESLQQPVIDLIVKIQREEFGFDVAASDQPDLLDVRNFYQTGVGNFWVALSDGKVIGTIALRDLGNHQGALRKMFVKASHRGKEPAVAARLLKQLIESAKANGVQEVFLGTTEKFVAAHRFYEKNGFVQVSPVALPTAFPRMSLDTRFYRRALPRDNTQSLTVEHRREIMWTREDGIETTAKPFEIWRLFSDVARWKDWNVGIEKIEIHGPFAKGTVFSMQPPGQEPFTSTLIEVRENEAFTDETLIDDTRVLVSHKIVPLSPGRTKIIYSTEITGASAEEIGPLVTADFPDVLAALKDLAEKVGNP